MADQLTERALEELRADADRIVGSREVLRGIKAGTLRRVFIANDVDTFLFSRVREAAEAAGIPLTRVESMQLLASACGAPVKTAAAGLKK